MKVLRILFAVVVIGLVGMTLAQSLKPRSEPPLKIQAIAVTKSAITRTVRGAGKLEPLRKVNVSSNITGVLLDLKVGIGSEVKKGQYLGQIDTSRYTAQANQQRAQLSAASAEVAREEANVSRFRNVLKRIEDTSGKAFTPGEREQAQTQVHVSEAQLSSNRSRVEAAKAQVAEAQKSLDWATLKAPVDGTVLSVGHRVGERVRGSDFAEDVVLVLGSLSKMDVRIDVGEHDVVHIRAGQKARIEIDALPDTTIEGGVLDISRDALVKNPGTDNEVITYPVWVSLDHPPPDALSGMSAQVTIFTETRSDAVAVPIQAVTVRPREPGSSPLAQAGPSAPAGGDAKPQEKEKAADSKPSADKAAAGPGVGGPSKLEKVVFVIKDGKATKRRVTTGISSDTQIEIISGLSEGEQVVEGPYRVLARDMKDGASIEIEKPKAGPGARGPGEENHR